MFSIEFVECGIAMDTRAKQMSNTKKKKKRVFASPRNNFHSQP